MVLQSRRLEKDFHGDSANTSRTSMLRLSSTLEFNIRAKTSTPELRSFIIPCHYSGNLENKVLRDRFVAGVRSEKVRELLVIEPNDVTLTSCIKLAQNVDRATSEASKVREVKPAAKKPEPIGAVLTFKFIHNYNKHWPQKKSKH